MYFCREVFQPHLFYIFQGVTVISIFQTFIIAKIFQITSCHTDWQGKNIRYDPVFFAKRITSTEVYISRAGLGDYICPPSGLAVCYNNLATPRKKMVWVQGSTHGFIPVGSEVIVWESK